MANKNINKVIYAGEVLIDLTADTVESSKMLKGYTAHDKSGAVVTGNIESKATQTYTPGTEDQTIAAGVFLSGNQVIKGDENLVAENIKAGTSVFGVEGSFTADADVLASEILVGKTAYKNGEKVTGTMKNNGGVAGVISSKDQVYTVPQGYHDGSGKVQIDATEQSKLIASNIRDGVTILGVTGSMSDTEGAKAETVDVVPSTLAQTILPNGEEGYNYLAQVNVAPIPYEEVSNEAGGFTVNIG
jgi:hypothetical protein